MKNIPAYKIVYSSLKQSIRDGSLPPGSFLPTETELCKQFNVSKTTIRKAISLLAQEGHIRVTQGRGTEVLDSSTTQKLNTVSSFTETLVQKGYSVSTRGGIHSDGPRGRAHCKGSEYPGGSLCIQCPARSVCRRSAHRDHGKLPGGGHVSQFSHRVRGFYQPLRHFGKGLPPHPHQG